jgi:hypothetical protein
MEGPEPHCIENGEVNEKILKHYGLWDVKARPSPRAKEASVTICLLCCKFDQHKIWAVDQGGEEFGNAKRANISRQTILNR